MPDSNTGISFAFSFISFLSFTMLVMIIHLNPYLKWQFPPMFFITGRFCQDGLSSELSQQTFAFFSFQWRHKLLLLRDFPWSLSIHSHSLNLRSHVMTKSVFVNTCMPARCGTTIKHTVRDTASLIVKTQLSLFSSWQTEDKSSQSAAFTLR